MSAADRAKSRTFPATPPPYTAGYTKEDTVDERRVQVVLDYDQIATLLGLQNQGLAVYGVAADNVEGTVTIGIQGESLRRISSTGEPPEVFPGMKALLTTPPGVDEDGSDNQVVFIHVEWDDCLRNHLEGLR